MIVYISIGNSDDKLTQSRWADYVQDVRDAISDEASAGHGLWFSEPSASWQNACWCVEVSDIRLSGLKSDLRRIAGEYGQDSIAWAEAPVTEFLGAEPSR